MLVVAPNLGDFDASDQRKRSIVCLGTVGRSVVRHLLNRTAKNIHATGPGRAVRAEHFEAGITQGPDKGWEVGRGNGDVGTRGTAWQVYRWRNLGGIAEQREG